MNKRSATGKDKIYSAPFIFIVIYLFVEFIRPQELVPALAVIRPGIIAIGLVFLSLVLNFKALYLGNTQTKLFFALLLLMTIHGPIAENNYWAFQVWYYMLTYLLVFVAVINFVNTPEKIERLVVIWLVMNLFAALIGIKHEGTVPSVYMKDENDFSLVMNLALPLAYFMFLEGGSGRRKLFYISACVLFVIASVISLSRGGFIGLAVTFLYCWYKSPNKLAGVILVSLLVGALFLTAPDKYFDEIKSIRTENIQEGTGANRWYLWQRGWMMFLDHPLIGVGQGNFPWNVAHYEPSGGFHRMLHGSRVAHSLYFTLIPELGLAGIFLFSGILLYSLLSMRNATKNNKEPFSRGSHETEIDLPRRLHKMKFIAFGITGALWAFMVSAIFLTVLYYPHLWLLLAFATAIGNTTKNMLKLHYTSGAILAPCP